MNQDKLEEIARLLGGISDKLDVVVRNLAPPDRIEVREASTRLGHNRGFVRTESYRTECTDPASSAADAASSAERAAVQSRDAAQHVAAIAHRDKFGGQQ